MSWPPPPDWWIEGTDPPDVDPFYPDDPKPTPDEQKRP